MATSYNTRFATYYSVKKMITQLIPIAIWKAAYDDYVAIYPFTILGRHLEGLVTSCFKRF
jgi:hypothetical protein